jgi:hypothetical protein
MKHIFKNIQTLLIVVLIGIIILMRSCSTTSPTKPKTIIKTTIEYIPVTDTVPEYIPKWSEKIIVEIDTFREPIDTTEILKDYYSKYYYVDTLKVDTFGFVLVKDTVSQNKIASRNIEYNINVPKITIEKTTYLNNREFYLGPSIQGNREQLNYVGGELYFKTKKSQLYGVGIGVNNNLQPVLKAGMYWKIGK